MLNSQSSDKPEVILTSRIRDRLVARQKPGGGGWWGVRSKRTKIVVEKLFKQTNNEFNLLTFCCIRAIDARRITTGISAPIDIHRITLSFMHRCANAAQPHGYAVWHSLPVRSRSICDV